MLVMLEQSRYRYIVVLSTIFYFVSLCSGLGVYGVNILFSAAVTGWAEMMFVFERDGRVQNRLIHGGGSPS